MRFHRRDFLKIGAGTLLVGGMQAESFRAFGAPRQALEATPSCGEETEENAEGPFYRAGAPERFDLIEPGVVGTPLWLSGVIRAQTCTLLAGGVVDLWQADGKGVYDNTGFRLRGRATTDAQGRWKFRTVIPGHYGSGRFVRPKHIHLKVSAPGHALITTQLYFAGDRYNVSNPMVLPSLIMTPKPRPGGGQKATFDFVLAST